MRHRPPDPPAETGVVDGLAYALFLPADAPRGGIVVIHGAGSCKERHFDFARAARTAGLAAVAYDQRGHGESSAPLDDRLVDDVATIAGLLPAGPVALRGSSMGGYVALLAAARIGADAAVAICPASAAMLLRGVRAERFDLHADRAAVERFLERNELAPAVARLDCAILLLHAEADEQVPVEHSRELHDARPDRVRLVVVPGGHHRSIQHDAELQGESLRFIERSFAG